MKTSTKCCKSRHKWSSDYSLVGGCKENPGVWSLTGDRWKFVTACVHCGVRRIEVQTYGKNNSVVSFERKRQETATC